MQHKKKMNCVFVDCFFYGFWLPKSEFDTYLVTSSFAASCSYDNYSYDNYGIVHGATSRHSTPSYFTSLFDRVFGYVSEDLRLLV